MSDRLALTRAVIDKLSFRFAKTMAHIPHEYVRRTADNEEAYLALFRAIQEDGEWERFGKYHNRYLYPGDGWKYWAMASAVGHSRIINRAKVPDE